MFQVISGALADTVLTNHTVTTFTVVSMLELGLVRPGLVVGHLSDEEEGRHESAISHP